MGSEKPNFLSQPVVKNIFMYRNGDPYYDARRIVINHKRVSNFETLLREVTGGIQAPFGAVRNIYTPRGGHKVDSLESLQSGEQYVAAGRERFRRLDYLQIGSRRKRMMQTLPIQAKPTPPNRIVVSARFLKPIKEPCTIFVVANGDVLNPAMRLLIHQRILGQFERVLEVITEKMGMRVLGGIRSLYTYEGQQVTDGNQLECGQLYVAVGRERFKKLPYSDLLLTKPRGIRRVNGTKANSLPPIYRFSKQNGNSKTVVRCSDSGGEVSKISLPGLNGSSKDHLSSIVREISQARLMSLRKRRSEQSETLGIADNDDPESKDDDVNAEDKTSQDQPADEKPADDDGDAKAAEQNGEKEEQREKEVENTTKEDTSAIKEERKENQKTSGQKEGGEEDEKNDKKEGEATAGSEEKEEEVKEEVKEEVTEESKEEVKEEGSSVSSSEKTSDSKEKEDGNHTSSEGRMEDKHIEEEKRDSGKGEQSREERVNGVDTGEEQTETENSRDPGKTRSDKETKESDNGRSSRSSGNQGEEESQTTEGATKESGEEEREVNGEVSREEEEEEEESGAELDMEEDSAKGDAENGEKEAAGDEQGKQDQSRKD
ncbi:doublecortin domain-containing protein 2-like [Pseudochaenichthys georgianus]|uniref:doublecortin domain-containing protein 2-like n=1 Tax=Pseudochaenichthys georgianus TaxID=52239 RepID=UPI00146C2C6F|nr:doublecortin domain-containing protein 2-like [Pseudochaenichthys georgianus]